MTMLCSWSLHILHLCFQRNSQPVLAVLTPERHAQRGLQAPALRVPRSAREAGRVPVCLHAFCCMTCSLACSEAGDLAAGCRMLLRYPVAKKSIRKYAIRSVLREDLVCYTLALGHVRQNMGMPHQPLVLPSKEDIRGSHLSQQKYHR